MKFLRKELHFIRAVFLFRVFLLYIKMDISFTSDQESRPFFLYLCFKLTYISAHFRWEIMPIFTKEQLRKAVHSFKHDLLFFFIYGWIKISGIERKLAVGSDVCLQQGAVCFHSGRGYLRVLALWFRTSFSQVGKDEWRRHVVYCGKELKANLRRCTLLHTPTYSDLKQHLCFLMRLRVFVQRCGYY